MTVRTVPLAIPEEVFLRDTDRKRAKKGILGGTEEKIVFAKTIFLPYLDFTYRYPAEKGFVSKQTVISEGRSTILALREANFGFDPRLVALAPMLTDMEEDSSLVVRGVDSTVLVSERLAELKNLLRDYEVQSEERSKQYEALPKESPARESLKENIEFLRKTKLLRWKMFADGLQLPAKLDLDRLALLDYCKTLSWWRETVYCQEPRGQRRRHDRGRNDEEQQIPRPCRSTCPLIDWLKRFSQALQ